jgi:hypothetical protein
VLTSKVWHRLLGVERTVVEEIEFDDEAGGWWRMCARVGVPGSGVAGVGDGPQGLTGARAGGDGGLWI